MLYNLIFNHYLWQIIILRPEWKDTTLTVQINKYHEHRFLQPVATSDSFFLDVVFF